MGKKQKYFTFVTDLETSRIIFVGEGKDADSLAPFFQRVKRCKSVIKAASIDMGPAYISAVSTNLSDAVIVFDHFHVVKLINSKLDALRRQAAQQAEALGLPVQKGLRWVLLKNPENLTDQQRSILDDLLQCNTPLVQAYLLKEQIRSFWDLPCEEQAKEFLEKWLNDLRTIDSAIMGTLANTIEKYAYGLFNYFEYPISSGLMEGLNNKIATMVKQAYGYRDIEYFKLKVKAIHETRYALLG